MKSEITIEGQTIRVIDRKCKGCAKRFKVAENSKQKFHSQGCADFNDQKMPAMAPGGHEEALALPRDGILWTDEI